MAGKDRMAQINKEWKVSAPLSPRRDEGRREQTSAMRSRR